MKTLAKRMMLLLIALTLVTVCGLHCCAAYAADVDPTVTAVTASPAMLSSLGGDVSLQVEGQGLDEENWDMDVHVYNYDLDVTDREKAPKYTILSKTAEGAVLHFSKNYMSNDLTVRITVGIKSSDGISEQATAVLSIAKKDYKTLIIGADEVSAELSSDYSMRVQFKNSFELKVSEDNLKSLIRLKNASGEVIDSAVTGIRVEGNDLDIEYSNNDPKLTTTEAFIQELYAVEFEDGALKFGETEDGTDLCNSTFHTIIRKKPAISSVMPDKTILGSEGGEVKVLLDGYRADSDELGEVTAYLMKAGISTPTDINVKVSRADDGKPVLSFTLPQNTSERTESYILKVKIGGSEVIADQVQNRAKSMTISVLAAGTSENEPTLAAMSVTAMNGSTGEGLSHATAVVSSNIGELKAEVRLYGTNLDVHKTKLRGVDENGIIWPVYNIPECDGSIRFVAIAGTDKNGIFGNGNSQLIELLPPRYCGTDKTYTLQVSIDGEHWIEDPSVKLTVLNSGISGEAEFTDCTDKNFKYVTVRYLDSAGKELAPVDVYTGYSVTMLQQFEIAAKNIPGYKLVKSPSINKDGFVGDGKEYTYVYEKTGSSAAKNAIGGLKLGLSSYVYDGKVKTPSIRVTDKSGKILTKGKDYTVSGNSSAKLPGSYRITVTGIGSCTGKLSASYKIRLSTTSVSSIKGQKNSFTVSVAKRPAVKVTGYQLRYSLKSSMSGAKRVSVGKKASVVRKTVRKLRSGRKYYVQVRTYKTIGGVKYYSSWSAKKSVRTK